MKELIHIDTSDCGRLHCDNPECKYVLPEAQDWGKHLIGYPCPKCGSDMLTERDYRDMEKMIKRIGWINKWFGPVFGREWNPKDPLNKMVSVRHHDGHVILNERGD
jgi:hypothetical protein